MLNIIDHFKKMIEQNQLAHAYIIDNINEQDSKACFIDLISALEILPQDYYFITPENISIGINSIREMTQRLSKSPIGNRHLIGINPADKLNIQACNALLKCLEEPPGNTCFVLFTNNARNLLPTVRSRSQIIRAPSSRLKAYESHSDFETIQAIYQFNPASLDQELLGVKLYHAMQSEHPFLAISQLDIKPLVLIQLSIQIIAYKIIQTNDLKLWDTYDKLITLSKDYQKAQNLNEKGILDRIGILFS